MIVEDALGLVRVDERRGVRRRGKVEGEGQLVVLLGGGGKAELELEGDGGVGLLVCLVCM